MSLNPWKDNGDNLEGGILGRVTQYYRWILSAAWALLHWWFSDGSCYWTWWNMVEHGGTESDFHDEKSLFSHGAADAATVFIHFRNANVDHADLCSSIMEHVGPRLKIACPIAPVYREANLPSTIWVLGVWISENSWVAKPTKLFFCAENRVPPKFHGWSLNSHGWHMFTWQI